MWTKIYDDNGEQMPGAWNTFKQTLRTNYHVVTKIDLLNITTDGDGFTVYTPIENGSINAKCGCNRLWSMTNVITDGNVDVDVGRGTRRTAELSILNPTAEFTPATGDFDPEGPWVGKIYLNRVVRIWRGLHGPKVHMFVPIGTFMIDIADVLMEQNMSMVNLTMSDFWKRLSKSRYAAPKTYEKNTRYNEIIRDMLDTAGIPLTGPYAAVIDTLDERDAEDRRTNIKISFEVGDSRGERLKELCDRWDIDIYFDPMGVLRTEDRRDAKDRQSVWSFYSSPEQDGMLVSMRRSFNDDNLYNHVIIVGTGGDRKTPVRVSRRDDNPRSKTNVDAIGQRTYLLETEKISTENEARRALDRAWKNRFQLSEEIEAKTICNPALEGDDVVTFTERDFIKIDGKYRLRAFNVPLVSSLQTISAMNIVRQDDL